MAVVKYGSIVTEIKGKVGGGVFQRCGQSLSLRSQASQRVASSLKARAWRSSVGVMAGVWRSLSAANRQTWITYAPTYPSYNRFGVSKVLTGYQLFVLINSFKRLRSQVLLQSIGTYSPPADTDGVIEYFNTSTSTAPYLADSAVPANVYQYWFVSNPYSQLSVVANPKLFYAFALAPGTAVGTNLFSSIYNAMRIKPLAGNTIYFEVYNFQNVTGQYVLVQQFSILAS